MSAVLLSDALWVWAVVHYGVTSLCSIAVLFLFFHVALCMAAMRFLIGFFPIIEGEFPANSPQAARWMAQAALTAISSGYLIPLVPFFLRAPWYRLFGARIGKGVVIGGSIIDCSLTVLKDGSAVGADALVLGHVIANGKIRIGSVVVGENALIGAKSLVLPGTRIEAGATVAAMSLVTSGKTIPKNETWAGIPAKRFAPAEDVRNRHPRFNRLEAQTVGKNRPRGEEAISSRGEVGP